MTTISRAGSRLLHVTEFVAALMATAMVSMILYETVLADAPPRPEVPPRETTCWSEPMSDVAPLACGEHAARIRAESGAAARQRDAEGPGQHGGQANGLAVR